MAKRLKLRISRVLASSFQSCRTKDPSISNPVPSFFRFSPNLTVDIQPSTPQPPPPSSATKPHHHSSLKTHVSSTLVSVGCGSSRSNSNAHNRIEPQLFQWQNKEEEWQLVYRKSPPRTESCHNPTTFATHKKKKKRRNTRKKTTADNIALFSSEEKERAQSSRSFSSDSSAEFNPIREKPRKKKKKKRKGGCVANGLCRLSVSSSPARLSVFKKLIPAVVEGKVKDSFAVVKKSEDPYEDFKKSMMDMIWEKQMFEQGDLEQLLECFLSLNSPRHHKVIVEAFAEIWSAMFTTSNPTGTGTSTSRNSSTVSVVDCQGGSSSYLS